MVSWRSHRSAYTCHRRKYRSRLSLRAGQTTSIIFILLHSVSLRLSQMHTLG